MGTLVAVDTSAELKPLMTVSTVVAGSAAITQGQLGVFYGDDVIGGTRKVERDSALRACLEGLREGGTITPDALAYSYCIADITSEGKAAIKSKATFNAVAPTILESHIVVFYRDLFQPLPGSSITTAARRAGELQSEAID